MYVALVVRYGVRPVCHQLVRWGANGLAFTTRVGAPADFTGIGPGQLYVISGTFVNPAGSSGSPVKAPALPVQRTWGNVTGKPGNLLSCDTNPATRRDVS
jgi:hypothetical protein